MNSKKLIIIIGAIIVIIVFFVIYFDTKVTDYPFQNSARPIAGNPDAEHIIIDYSDFQCPYCATAFQLLKQVEEKYYDDIRVEYMHFPLPSHLEALQSAEASECANDQGKFWQYAEILFANQSRQSQADLINYATGLDLDVVKFRSCLDSKVNRQIISADIKSGNDLKIQGTPTIYLDGQEVSNWQNLDQLVSEKINN